MKHQVFCKGNIFFRKTTWCRPIYKVVLFYLKRGAVAGHSFLQTWLFLKDQLEPSIPSCKVIYFTEQLQPSILSGVIWNIIFDSSYLLRIATFLEELFYAFDIFKGSLSVSLITTILPLKQDICFCHRKSSSRSFFKG